MLELSSSGLRETQTVNYVSDVMKGAALIESKIWLSED